MEDPRILVIGGARTEYIIRAPYLPSPGKRIFADRFTYMPGGHGTISSVTLARLGADVLLCSKLGGDPNADDLIDYLRAEKVDTRLIDTVRGESTEIEVIIKEEKYPERRLCYPGTALMFSAEDIEDAFICYPDAVILHNEITEEAAREAIRQAKIKELPLFIMSLPEKYSLFSTELENCEILCANEAQTFEATGIAPSDQEKCMKACMVFMQKVDAKFIVLRLGERGYFVYDGMYYNFISAYDVPIPQGVSSEDVFSAALVLEYLRSEGDIKRACEFGAIVSAIFLSRGGGRRAYPNDEDIIKFIRRNEIDFEYGDDKE